VNIDPDHLEITTTASPQVLERYSKRSSAAAKRWLT